MIDDHGSVNHQSGGALHPGPGGVRVAQVRVIFTLPRQFGTYSRALAYIEWFTPFREPDRVTFDLQLIRITTTTTTTTTTSVLQELP